jgi:hypothetical protein
MMVSSSGIKMNAASFMWKVVAAKKKYRQMNKNICLIASLQNLRRVAMEFTMVSSPFDSFEIKSYHYM